METFLLASNNFVNLKFEIILFKILREDYMSTILYLLLLLFWLGFVEVVYNFEVVALVSRPELVLFICFVSKNILINIFTSIFIV